MSTSLNVILLFATASVAFVVLDPIWVRMGWSYYRFTPMLRRMRLSPRMRDREQLELLFKRLGALWGCPIEWKRSGAGVEFHGRGLFAQWLGCGRIVDLDGRGWLSVEIPFRQCFLIPFAVANILIAGWFGSPVAAGLLLPVVGALLIQWTFAQRLELVARLASMRPERRAALIRAARMRMARTRK
jgi:hypothetical protein